MTHDAAMPDFTPFIRPGDTVIWGQATAEPLTLTRALVAQRHRLARLRLVLGIDLGRTLLPAHADAFDFISYCGAGGNRQLARAGLLDILPCAYSQLPEQLRHGQYRVDVVLLQVSPADAQGRHSLGLANDWLIPALGGARTVIAEVNPDLPWTFGAATLGAADIDLLVPARHAPLQMAALPATPVDTEIARRVAALVEDGATLQLGLGGVSDQVLAALGGHRHLGLHTGVVGDAIVGLAESGALTNARKTLDRGVGIAGILMGSRRLYDFAHRNRDLQLRGCNYTHDAEVLRTLDRFTAINSALEVDLTGQINAEVAAGQYVGAVGGAPDFLRAAHLSSGGLPIIALPATAGERSRIVPRLNGPVSTSRCDAGLIVTEYGVADLRGQSLKTRIRRMIDIAAPQHRAALECGAREALGYAIA
ncbi:MAG: acetyl-CoA hydrolase/transferase C-terminal domain-containing protein [Pseudomonadota bacterium]